MKRGVKILIVFLVVISFILIGGFYIFSSSCTLIGCMSTLTLVLPEPIPSDNLAVVIDDYEIVDNCNRRYQNFGSGRYENRIYLPSQHLLSSELIKEISSLKIGYRETCESEITTVYSYSNLPVEYKSSQPNGPRCEPTCYNAVITLE